MCWDDLDLLQKGCFFRPHPAKVPQKIDSSRIFRAAVEPRAQRKAIAEIEAGIRLPGSEDSAGIRGNRGRVEQNLITYHPWDESYIYLHLIDF